MSKYLKAFDTKEEYDQFLVEHGHDTPHVAFIKSTRKLDFHPRKIFPMCLNTTEIPYSGIFGERYKAGRDADCLSKALVDYFFEHCVPDTTSAYNTVHLELTDEQELYIDGTKVNNLYYSGEGIGGDTSMVGTIDWSPVAKYPGTNILEGIYLDGSISVEDDD